MTKKGFTLVELIVVITILAILGTIAFLSLQSYAKNARDTKRLSDIANIKKSLELFIINVEKYPLPDNAETVTYSGEIVWYQGDLGDNVLSTLSRNLKKKPLDPLTEEEYVYSTTDDRVEYEVLALYEGDIVYENSILPQSYAVETGLVKVEGNYNQLYTETDSFIIPVPSLITSEPLPLVLDSENIKSQVVTGKTNRPQRTGSSVQTGGLDIVLSVYTGSVKRGSTNQQKLDAITAIQTAYSGTTLSVADTYTYLLNQESAAAKLAFAETTILNTPTEVPDYNCPTQPGYSNAVFVIGNLTNDVGSWQNSDINSPCYYECTGGYSGSDCSTAPPLLTQSVCTSAGWYWVPSANDVYIGSSQGSGFCISPRMGDFGISWNGWGNVSGSYFYGWGNLGTVADSGSSHIERGQVRRLDGESGYSCKALGTASSDYDTTDGNGDTIHNRMKRLVTNKASSSAFQNIDWISGATAGSNVNPALFLSDCIDGVKDLTTDMNYTHSDDGTDSVTYAEYNVDNTSGTAGPALTNVNYQNRQKYLTAWTQKSGSHLPSAFSYIVSGASGGCPSGGCDNLTGNGRGEYQVACDAGLLSDANDTSDGKKIWLAAVGRPAGWYWGRYARRTDANGCGDQYGQYTGYSHPSKTARFVVRP